MRALRSRRIDLPPAELIVVDECHHARARTWQEIIEAYPNAVVLGLTATPARGDGRGLGNIFDCLIESATIKELIERGFLVSPVYYAPTRRPDLEGVHIRRGDYVESELAERMNTAKLVGDIVEHYHRITKAQRHTVIFCVNVAHSRAVRDALRRSGVLAEHIDGSTPAEERDAILARLKDGSVDVVCNCQVLTEGWDCPVADCVILARPTKSLVLFRQMVGRALRSHPGKPDALVIDQSTDLRPPELRIALPP
jgi:DNA repair protein RadD